VRIALKDVCLEVQVEGSGPDVLLVHGFPDDHLVWRGQVAPLAAAGYRVIAPDMRGCGESDAPPRVGDYRIDRLVADLAGVLDALGASRVRLIGHDWGAVIAWQFCMLYPGRVESLAVLSVGHPNAYARAPLRQKLMGWYIAFLQLRGLAEWTLRAADWRFFRAFSRYPAESAKWIASLSRPGRLTAAVSWYRANLAMVLPRECPPVVMPVMGVWSSGDRFLCEEQMTASARYVGGPWRYERLEGPSHWLQLDAPERVNALLIDHLRPKAHAEGRKA